MNRDFADNRVERFGGDQMSDYVLQLKLVACFNHENFAGFVTCLLNRQSQKSSTEDFNGMRKRNQRQSQKFLQNLGDSIRGRRVELALSQEELGLQCTVHRSYITEIENGMRNVSVLTLNKIAKALKLEVWELLRFEHDGNHDGKELK